MSSREPLVPGGAGHRSFTLIEVIIVVGVIGALVSIVLAVGQTVTERSRIDQTRAILVILDAATNEWQRDAARPLTWWQTGDPPQLRARADVHADTPEVFIITEIIEVIGRSESVQAILSRIDIARWHTYRSSVYPDWVETPIERQSQEDNFVGARTVVDAWGTPVYATHPGRLWNSDDMQWQWPRDPDGTIRTYNETKYGVAPARNIVYVSAGPDGLFGIDEEFLDIPAGERPAAKSAARKDNVFSRPVKFAGDTY